MVAKIIAFNPTPFERMAVLQAGFPDRRYSLIGAFPRWFYTVLQPGEKKVVEEEAAPPDFVWEYDTVIGLLGLTATFRDENLLVGWEETINNKFCREVSKRGVVDSTWYQWYLRAFTKQQFLQFWLRFGDVDRNESWIPNPEDLQFSGCTTAIHSKNIINPEGHADGYSIKAGQSMVIHGSLLFDLPATPFSHPTLGLSTLRAESILPAQCIPHIHPLAPTPWMP